MTQNPFCRICKSQTAFFANARILSKYDISYFHCPHCAFVQTEDPYWLAEAYQDAIIKTDIGLVARNVSLCASTKPLMNGIFDPTAKFVDYGGGYGMYVRMMRDVGFDFYRLDPHCENLFAQQFDAEPEAKYEALTAFEVFEHLVDPLKEIRQMLTFSTNILFSTHLISNPPPHPDSFWYYALDGGQHVSLYTRRTLEVLAEQLGLYLATDGHNLHLLTARRATAYWFSVAIRPKYAKLFKWSKSRASLLPQDYQRMTGKDLIPSKP